ncbi:25S rRNA (cytosine2278-C5)-methyltransferase [Enteropsectra breve]|nr:25S rRNA (cytosine2278-C5)-methyltransferase [Enteropsectra breve]
MAKAQLKIKEYPFYEKAAVMLEKIAEKQSTLKTEVYKTTTHARYYALLDKIVPNLELLCEIASDLPYKNKYFGCIIVYEILTGRIKNKGYKKKLQQKMQGRELKTKEKMHHYVRINTMKASESILQGLNYSKTCVPDVYLVPDEQEKNSSIKHILQNASAGEHFEIQNLASCLPAFILSPREGSTVIDATAAPGNKTTHLCSLMNNTGRIYAFEKDGKRFQGLKQHLEKYGATNAVAENKDFHTVSPDDYKVDYILLDPSCSGSGIHSCYVKEQERVDRLQKMQHSLLSHALSFKPKRLVYSTCSVHEEENEEVIKMALESNTGYELATIGDFWPTRGLEKYPFASKVIRSYPNENGSIGFFTALLERKNQEDL